MKFSDKLRELRKQKDFSQEYLAERLGVTRQTISKWENGSAMPDLKRLTEIAELFGVSMDELLGIEAAADENKTAGNQYDPPGNQYNPQIISAIGDNQAEIYAKRQKDTTRNLSIVLALIVIAFIIFIIAFQAKINNLKDQITNLEFRINSMNPVYYYDDGDYEQPESDFVAVDIIGADSEKPYIAQVQFTYTPESYAKNASVSFLIPEKDGSTHRVDAVEENGEFTVTADIDLTIFDGELYLIIDDGEKVVKDSLNVDLCGRYYEIVMQEYDYTVERSAINFEYCDYDGNYYDGNIYCAKAKTGKITSAEIVVEDWGSGRKKELFNQLLTVETSDNDEYDYMIAPPDKFTIKLVNELIDLNIKAYLKLTDENGTVCKYYFCMMCVGGSIVTYDVLDPYTEIFFNVDGEEYMITNSIEY